VRLSAPVLISTNCSGFRLLPPFLLADVRNDKKSPPALWYIEDHSRTLRQLRVPLERECVDEEGPFFPSVGATQREKSYVGGRYAVDAERGLLMIITTVPVPHTVIPELGLGTLHIIRPLHEGLLSSTPLNDSTAPYDTWILRRDIIFGAVQRYARGPEVVICQAVNGHRKLSTLAMPARDLQTDEDGIAPVPAPAHFTRDGSLVAVADIPGRASCEILRWNGPIFLDGQVPDAVLRLDQAEEDDEDEDEGMSMSQQVQALDETAFLLSIETRDTEWNYPKHITVYALDTTEGLFVRWMKKLESTYDAGSIYNLTVLPEMRAIVVVGSGSTHNDSAFIEVWDAATGQELSSRPRSTIRGDLNGGVQACAVKPDPSGRLSLVIVYGNGQMTVLAFEDYLQHGLIRTQGLSALQGDPLPDAHVVRGADIDNGVVIRHVVSVFADGLSMSARGDLEYVTWDLV
jgi:hypothetical protein